MWFQKWNKINVWKKCHLETRNKISEANKIALKWNKIWLWKKHSEGSKKKMSMSRLSNIKKQRYENFNNYIIKKIIKNLSEFKKTFKHKLKKSYNRWLRVFEKIKFKTLNLVKRKRSWKNHWSWKWWISKDKKYRSWQKNKRNRVIKRLKTESLSHTYWDWELLKKQYGYTCPCCKKGEPEIRLTEDHIIPLSKWGSDLIENIQPLCQHCNSMKHTKTIKY